MNSISALVWDGFSFENQNKSTVCFNGNRFAESALTQRTFSSRDLETGNVAVLTELSGRMRRPTFSSASFTENKMKQPFLTVFAEIKYWYSSGTGETSACSEERTIYIALLVGIKPAGTRHSNFLLLRKISNARSKFAALRTVPGVIFQARGCALMVFLLHCFVCL